MNRYSRQTSIIGGEGQKKLLQARVLIVGVGGLGSPIALYLAAAGIGTLGLVDSDVVGLSNLQRQVLYSESEVGAVKVKCAKRRLQSVNSSLEVEAFPFRLEAGNADEIISNFDVIVDGCDNLETRYLIDEVTKRRGIPYVFGAINACDGQVAVFNYKSGTSYSDLFPRDFFSGEEETISKTPGAENLPPPVIGMTPAIIGSVQAMEVVKILTGVGQVLDGKLWTYDLLNNESSSYNIAALL